MGYFKECRDRKEAQILKNKEMKLKEIEEYNAKQQWEETVQSKNIFKLWRWQKYDWYRTWDDVRCLYPFIDEHKVFKCKILDRSCSDGNCLVCAVAMKELGLKIIIKDE